MVQLLSESPGSDRISEQLRASIWQRYEAIADLAVPALAEVVLLLQEYGEVEFTEVRTRYGCTNLFLLIRPNGEQLAFAGRTKAWNWLLKQKRGNWVNPWELPSAGSTCKTCDNFGASSRTPGVGYCYGRGDRVLSCETACSDYRKQQTPVFLGEFADEF